MRLEKLIVVVCVVFFVAGLEEFFITDVHSLTPSHHTRSVLRQTIPFKQLALTNIKVEIPRSVRRLEDGPFCYFLFCHLSSFIFIVYHL